MKSNVAKYLDDIKGKKILIQGLGLNGGGVGTALFFLENDIPVTITDLKTEDELHKSLKELSKYKNKITYVLGEHREKDFQAADIIVKGPGVSPTNQFIQIAKRHFAQITSDIEIFLKITPCPVYALTGSKGKSSTVSAIYSIFKTYSKNSFLGGNITISPLTFYKKLDKNSLVILELSSWQLRDMESAKFQFKGAGITNLMNDHQNYYSNMEDYLKDKSVIASSQGLNEFFILPYNDSILNFENIKTNARPYFISVNDKKADFYFSNGSAYISNEKIFNENIIKVYGEHNKFNILFAAAFCKLAGIDNKSIVKGIKKFKGTPYRLQLVREWNGIKFINDTTATIPEAAISALKSFKEPIIWIAGGNDKNLDFTCVKEVADIPKKIFLLKGNGTDKLKGFLGNKEIHESNSLKELLDKAVGSAAKGDIILLSPGCTSFGLFQNEFHRGDVFNDYVKKLS